MAQERPARSGMPVSFVPAWRDTCPLRGSVIGGVKVCHAGGIDL